MNRRETVRDDWDPGSTCLMKREMAAEPAIGKFVVLRVPYPLGFYSRGLDGRIDDPKELEA
jgi:hypothetical protein